MVSKDIDNRMVLEGDSRMPIKQQIKKFEIRNNLAPVFCNRLKQIETVIKTSENSDQTSTETITNVDKRKRTSRVHKDEARGYLEIEI